MEMNDYLFEEFLRKILSLLNVYEEQHLEKYISKNHIAGNLIIPRRYPKEQSVLELDIKSSFAENFLVDSIKVDPKLNIYHLVLNHNCAFRTSLQTVLKSGRTYGANFPRKSNIQIVNSHNGFIESDSLSKYRLHLCSAVAQKLLTNDSSENLNIPPTVSKCIESVNECLTVCILDHHEKLKGSDCTIYVVCRTEINQLNGEKNASLSYKDYKMLRENDVRKLEEGKFNDHHKINCIVNGCVVFDLLSSKLNAPVFLDLTEDSTMFRNSSSRGAIFVLYTYARIASIINKFDKFVSENDVKLPSIEDTDFSSLNTSAEKVILYNYILTFPTLIRQILNELWDHKKFPIHKLCIFLTQFSSVVSKYYRVTRILTTQTPKLFPQMFARIFLLRATLQVFQNGLHYLCVEPVPEM